MTPLSVFESYETIAPGKHVQTADGTLLPVVGIGQMNIQPIGKITNVLHVPKLCVSLISVQRIAKMKDYNILFDDIDAYLCHKVHGWKTGLAKVQQGLYYLPRFWKNSLKTAASLAKSKVATVQTSSKEKIMEIHQRMGHPSFDLLKILYPYLFEKIEFDMCICNACQLGKFKRSTYPPTNNRTQRPFQLLHCDVWGPSPHTDILGNRYFLVCTDDHSRFSWLILLKNKTEVTTNIKNLCKMIKCQFGDPVRGLRTDNAKDFLNHELREFLASEGIKHETSCPYTPQQNGLAERKIGDIVDKGRTLLIQASTPLNLWGFAVMTAVHLINRLPSSNLGLQSPLEILEEKYPEVRLKTGLPVKIFGCVAYVHNPLHKNDKWSAKALKCVFLGYSATQKGYKVYHPLTRKHLVSKDIVFDEKMFFYQSTVMKELRNLPYLTIPDEMIIHQTETQEDNRTVSIPQFQQQEDILAPTNLETAPEEKNPEEVTNNQGTVVPYPKYYERRSKRKLLESEVNQKIKNLLWKMQEK